MRIVQRCVPALIKYLEMQTDADSAGLLVSITDFRFVFLLNFQSEVFMLSNATSQALRPSRAKDDDLALAATFIDNLETAIAAMRSDVSYQRMFNAAKQRCESLNIYLFIYLFIY